jgi:co-chaperonin GroES (HSP10)
MIPEVFEANLLIELIDDNFSNGLYKVSDTASAVRCKVVAVGDGWLIPEQKTFFHLPWVVGDELLVLNRSWLDITADGENYKIIKADKVLARVKK